MRFARGLSLRQKLPLLVFGLSAGALLLGGTLAYLEVRRAARVAAEVRLAAVAQQLARQAESGQDARGDLEARIASSPVIRAAIRRQPVDTALAYALLDSLRDGSDGDLPVTVLRPDGTVALRVGALNVAADQNPTPPLLRERAIGEFRAVGQQTLYWVTVPVPGPGDDPLGWVTQRRRIGDSDAAGSVALLLGADARVLVGQLADSSWVDLARATVEGRSGGIRLGEPFVIRAADGTEMLAVGAPVAGTPWVVLAERSMGQVMARAIRFRNLALGIGALLLLAVVFVGWRASAVLTDPLAELANAADAIAGGDYDRRVDVATDNDKDEVARLARAFNAMVEHVARSDEALRLQLDEAQALALRLEEATARAERAREDAQAADRAKSDFLATMSHEIRTPINAVIGYTDLLDLGIPDPPTPHQRDYLRRIDRANQLLLSLVNDLLDFSRIESGQMRVEMGIGSAEDAILAGAAALEPEAARKRIRLTSHYPAGACFYGDQQRVQQIVLNLLSNAVKFTPEGGAVSVRCLESRDGPSELKDGGPWLRIEVEDTGIGIEGDQVQRVFEPFVQGRAGYTREHGGAGLGLAISRRLAQMMSGTITVSSVPGQGSRFALWLRRAPDGEADRPTERVTGASVPGGGQAPRRHGSSAARRPGTAGREPVTPSERTWDASQTRPPPTS